MSALKISLLWIVMVICLNLHGNYHFSEFMYGVDLRIDTSGKLPLELHLFRIILEILPLVFAILTLYLNSKIFKRLSFVWIMVLAPIHTFLWMYGMAKDPGNYSKHALLVLVLVVNIALFFAVRRWKELPD